MGLDVGMKTIGVAISDELGLAAHPTTTISRQGMARDADQIAVMARERGVTDIVIGLPLELSGAVGRRATRVRMFADALGKSVGPGVALHEWDERFSTVAVERILIQADLSRRQRKRIIDKQAAAYILQGWLDARRQAL